MNQSPGAEPSTSTSGSDVASEIDAALDNDSRKIGEVWETLKNTDDTTQIMEAMGWTRGPVYSYRTYIRVLRGEDRPPKGTMALQCARQIASFVRRHHELSSDAKEILNARRQDCESVADEPTEPDEPSPSSFKDQAGVYVYTYAHYINHPVSDKQDTGSTPRTFLKVGKSDDDIEARVNSQTTTALPERPMTLRLYQSENPPAEVEAQIHSILKAADHHHPNPMKGAGREWFLTNLKFLDKIAEILELRIHRRHDSETTELET